MKERGNKAKVDEKLVTATGVAVVANRKKSKEYFASVNAELKKPRVMLAAKMDFVEMVKKTSLIKEVSMFSVQKVLEVKFAETRSLRDEDFREMTPTGTGWKLIGFLR